MQRNQECLWRLGCDLGSNSLGWAALSLSNEGHPLGLIDMGVRIFSDGRDSQDQQSNAAKRRMPRGARRNRDRYLQRRAKFLRTLTEHGLMPADPAERAKVEALDPWVLRARGLEEALEPHELGRALFHLQQRRGFQSNRLTDKAGGEKGKINQGAEQARLAMGHNGTETLGQLKGQPRLENLKQPKGQRKAMPLARVRSHGEGAKLAYDYYPLREMIRDEFDLLWSAQAKHHPCLTDEVRDALRDALFFQRELKPQPVGRCTLEPDEERAPNALPSVQRLRIYQELNNLRIAKRSGEPRVPLSSAERDIVAAKLATTAKLPLKQIRTVLGLSDAASFSIEEGGRDFLDGNRTHDIMRGTAKNKAGWKGWADLPDEEQDALIEILLGRAAPVKGSPQSIINTHGQIIDRVSAALGVDDETALSLVETKDQNTITAFLCERYGIDEESAERIALVNLPDGHNRLSRTAGAKVLPHLLQLGDDGELRTFDKAVVAAGYKSHSLRGTGEVYDTADGLPYYGVVLEHSVAFGSGNPTDPEEKRIGKVANPTVHVALNQLRHVYNALAARLGPPAQIVIELARDLPLSAKGKADLVKTQRENRAANEKRSKELEAFGVPNTYENRMRLRLWEDLDATGKRCPYSGIQISSSVLFSGEIEIDHILPFSRTLDDGFGNKILAFRERNRAKGNRSPWEAVEAGIFSRDTIEDSMRDLPRNKAWRFGPDAMERFENEERGFLDRQLNDTRYISRLAKQFLDATGAQTWVVNGRLTADLRHVWGLNAVLNSHNSAPQSSESDAVRKNRNDHRHNAIDAFVVACTDRSMVKAAADAAKVVEDEFVAGRRETMRLLENVPDPFEGYLQAVRKAAARIIVSHKSDHGVQGELHEGTNYGVVKTQDGGQRLTTRKPVTGLTANEIKNIGDDRIRRELLPLVGASDAERKAALLKYSQDTGHLRVRIHKVQAAFETIRHGPDSKGESHYRAVIPGENYCMDVVETPDGKWQGLGVTRFEAHQPGWKKKWRRTFADGKLVMRLRKGDLLKILHDGEEKIMLVHDLRPSANLCKLAPHNETGKLQERHDQDYDKDPFRWDFGSISGYKQRRARPVRITADGQLVDPGPFA